MIEYDGYVIVDLDGCLSDDRWRRSWLPPFGSAPEAYDNYHAHCNGDDVVVPVRDDVLFDAYDENGRQRSLVLVVTSRPDKDDLRKRTEWWISNIAFHEETDFLLLMRPAEDRSASPTLKMRLLNQYFAGVHVKPSTGWSRVVSAYDDRLDVLDEFPIPNSCKFCRALEEPPEELLPADAPAEDRAKERAVADMLRAIADVIEQGGQL